MTRRKQNDREARKNRQKKAILNAMANKNHNSFFIAYLQKGTFEEWNPKVFRLGGVLP